MRRSRRVLAMLGVLALAATACTSTEEKASTKGRSDSEGSGIVVDAGSLTTGGTWEAPGIEIDAADLRCAGPAKDPMRGITDKTVKVGGLLTASGPTTAVFTDAEAGAAARFKRANAEGGVHGRTIDFVGVEDDGLEPTRQIDAARRLVNDEVFAVAPLISALATFDDPLCDATMPHFGWGFTSAWCETAHGFPITGCLVPSESDINSIAVGPIIKALDEAGGNTIALIGNEDEAAATGIKLTVAALERFDIEVVYTETILSPQNPITDVSPVVNDIMTAADGQPPALLYQVSDFPNTSAITEGMVAAGYDGILLNAVGYDPRLAAFEGFDGSTTNLQWAPFESTDVPFVAQMSKDFDKHAPKANKGLPAAAGYISADLLLAALEATGPDLTLDSFLETLNGGDFVYSVPDFKGDLKFPDNHMFSSPCTNLVMLEDGEYSAVTPITCNEPFLVDG